MTSRNRSRGYSLIEVLVAMMILALSLTVLLRIFSSGLRNVAVSEDYANAVLLAEAQLEAAVPATQVAGRTESGVVDRKFYWTRTVEAFSPYPASADVRLPVDAFTITVTVEWGDTSRPQQFSLSTVTLGPMKAQVR